MSEIVSRRGAYDRGIWTKLLAPAVDAMGFQSTAILFVQFDDGTTWGDPAAGKELLAARPQKLAFLKNLVETYYESGEDSFAARLNEPKLSSPEHTVAACLKSDAKYEKISAIELAKKRLAAAQEWRALGIF